MIKAMGLITLLATLAAPAVAQSSLAQSDLVCYMQTADGRTVDLGSICGSRTAREQRVTRPSTPVTASGISPYSNLGGLETAGRGPNAKPCFGLDDQGNRCPTAR